MAQKANPVKETRMDKRENVTKNDSKPKDKVKFGIQAKLLGLLLPMVVIVIGVILYLVYDSTSTIVMNKSEQVLKTSTAGAVNEIEAWRKQILLTLDTERSTMEYFDLTPEEELAYIRHTEGRYEDFPSGVYIGTTEEQLKHASFVADSTYKPSEKAWYTMGLTAKDFAFGSVYFDIASKSNVISASAMFRDNFNQTVGVMSADISLSAVSKLIQEVQIEQTGGMLLVDKETDIIMGHKDPSLVGVSLKDNDDELYTYITGVLAAGTTGLQTCTKTNGEQIYIDVAYVPGSQWAAISYVPSVEIIGDLNALTQRIIMLAIGAIAVLSIIIIVMIRRAVIRPVKQIDHVARRIAGGQLNESINYRSNDEFGALAANFNQTVTKLQEYVNYIDEIASVLDTISQGNLNFTLVQEYTGEFEKVKIALENISDSLNTTIKQIHLSANDLTENSEQVSSGSQALSQGTTEQASAIEELAATVSSVSEQIQKNAANAQKARQQSTAVGDEISESNVKMDNMIAAITQISEKSGEINKIIKTIDDIAFQTNILALNAAVEAARAGTAGKGFAVVADEVRNLASKSSEAAKNTTKLIEETVQAVENGTRIASDTAKSMLAVVENTQAVTSLMGDIAIASDEQANYVSQISVGIMQISNVVQTNSETASESAAASEELLGQAQMLKDLVKQFTFKD